MVCFTNVNPTRNPFNTGVKIDQPCKAGILMVGNPEIGSGTLVTFSENEIVTNGSYDRFGNSGNFRINVSPNGSRFNVQVELTGPASSYSRDFQATATEPQSGTIVLTGAGGDPQITLRRNNGSFVTDGKIEIAPNWAPVTLYIGANA